MSRHDEATGVIHDIGYQHYSGPRLGRGHIARSMYVHSVRTAFGLGRSARTKFLPVGLFAMACVAAVILVVVNNLSPVPVLSYVGLAGTFSYAAAVFVAIVGPELVSRDLRNNLLSMYFSRPVTRTDYALTKLAALASAVFILVAGPMLILYLGAVFSGKYNFSGITDQTGHFLLGLLAAAIQAIVLAAIAVPLAALTGRRVFATGVIIALFLLTEPVYGVLSDIGGSTLSYLAGLINPSSLLNGVDRWLFGEGTVDVGQYGPVYGLVAVVVAAAGVGLSILRYRTVKA
jgi:ABC-2 type transport system permease protein